MKQKARPYFAKSVTELTSLVRANPDNPGVLRMVAQELRHRTTASAKRLQAEVDAAIGGEQAAPRPKQAQLELVAPTAGSVMNDQLARQILGVGRSAPFHEIKTAWQRARSDVADAKPSDPLRKRVDQAYRFLEQATGSDF